VFGGVFTAYSLKKSRIRGVLSGGKNARRNPLCGSCEIVLSPQKVGFVSNIVVCSLVVSILDHGSGGLDGETLSCLPDALTVEHVASIT